MPAISPNLESSCSTVSLIHFNDVYNVEPRSQEPCGGAARFKTAVLSFMKFNPLILFSGDALGPSIMSTFTKGEQMLHVLNGCNVHCSVYGNHEFDFGVDNLMSFVKRTNFPWLMSNVFDNDTNRPLADGKIMHIIENNGKKFGIIGLVEEEWLATLATIEKEDVTYLDFVTEGRKLAKHLKNKENVDYVIALTHMRTPNDCRLANNVEEIDLILGGHDHDYEITKVNGKYIIKSGTDFWTFSKIDLIFTGTIVEIKIEKVNVMSNIYAEDPELKMQLEKYSDVVEGKMDTVLGHFNCDLDGRFSSIRTRETNLGNFVCDIMLACTHSDLAILNSGTLRSDRIHPKGDFTLRDMVTIMPMMDSMIVLNATGEQVWQALENGVSQWPKLEGRFPQVSGVRFAFDPNKPPGSRIDHKFVKIGDEYLDFKQRYRLVTKGYLRQGKDGYDVLKTCDIDVPMEDCPELITSMQNHFEAIKILSGHTNHPTRHRQSLVCISRRHSVVRMHETGQEQGSTCVPPIRPIMKGFSVDGRKPVSRRISIDEIEFEQCRLEPKVEGRITVFTDEVKNNLTAEKNAYFAVLCKKEVIHEEPED